MKFIKVSENLSVRKCEIEAVLRISDLKCKVYTKNNTFDSDYPYTTMLALLEMEQSVEEKFSNDKTNQLLEQMIKNQQVFVG